MSSVTRRIGRNVREMKTGSRRALAPAKEATSSRTAGSKASFLGRVIRKFSDALKGDRRGMFV